MKAIRVKELIKTDENEWNIDHVIMVLPNPNQFDDIMQLYRKYEKELQKYHQQKSIDLNNQKIQLKSNYKKSLDDSRSLDFIESQKTLHGVKRKQQTEFEFGDVFFYGLSDWSQNFIDANIEYHKKSMDLVESFDNAVKSFEANYPKIKLSMDYPQAIINMYNFIRGLQFCPEFGWSTPYLGDVDSLDL